MRSTDRRNSTQMNPESRNLKEHYEEAKGEAGRRQGGEAVAVVSCVDAIADEDLQCEGSRQERSLSDSHRHLWGLAGGCWRACQG